MTDCDSHTPCDRPRKDAELRPFDERGRPVPAGVDYVGRFTYGLDAMSVHAWDEATRLVVGSFNSIAGGVSVLLGGNHRTDWLTTFPFGHIFQDYFPEGQLFGGEGHPTANGNIVIENDAWIGEGATLLSGSRLSNGAVLAAKAVLTGPTEPYAIYAGVPARLVRHRHPPDAVEALLELAWWNWPLENVRRAIPILQQPLLSSSIERLRAVAPRTDGHCA